MNEIDEIRAGLEEKINELGKRLPPMAQWGRRAIGGVGGGVALYALTKARARVMSGAKKKRGKKDAPAPASGPIIVRGGISTPAALGVAAIWAGVRMMEAKSRSGQTERAKPAVVRDLPKREAT